MADVMKHEYLEVDGPNAVNDRASNKSVIN